MLADVISVSSGVIGVCAGHTHGHAGVVRVSTYCTLVNANAVNAHAGKSIANVDKVSVNADNLSVSTDNVNAYAH